MAKFSTYHVLLILIVKKEFGKTKFPVFHHVFGKVLFIQHGAIEEIETRLQFTSWSHCKRSWHHCNHTSYAFGSITRWEAVRMQVKWPDPMINCNRVLLFGPVIPNSNYCECISGRSITNFSKYNRSNSLNWLNLARLLTDGIITN